MFTFFLFFFLHSQPTDFTRANQERIPLRKGFLFNRLLTSRVRAMEKKRNLPPASSQLVEPPLKQHHQSEAEQENDQAFEQWLTKYQSEAEQENDQAFVQWLTNSVFRAFFSSSSIPFYCSGREVLRSASISFPGGACIQWETPNSMFGSSCSPAFRSSMSSSTPPAFDSSIFQTPLEAVSKEMEAVSKEMELKAAIRTFAATCTPKNYIMEKFSEVPEPYTLISIPAIITEEDGGTSGKTVKFQSCFAIAGADYCVIAADFTNISELSGKSAMASCGFQDDMKALQEELYAENLRYEREHKQPMSCPEMHRLLLDFENRHLNHDFIVLGGLDSEGKGRVFDLEGLGDDTIASEALPPGSIPIMAPILEYELPANDVLARLSETEAVELAKDVFRSATNTGDKLEIVVLNAKGLTRDNVDLRKEKKKNNSAVVESSSV